MRYTKIVSFFAMTITALAVMSSCEDDVNSKDLLAYIRLHRTVANYSLSCAYQPDGTILITDATKASSTKFAFEAGLTRTSVENTQLIFALDESLVEKYNKDNNTNLEFVKADAISFDSNGNIGLSAGIATVYDTVRIDFSKLEPAKNYLLPINITSVKSRDKGIVPSSNTSAIFLKITTGICNNISPDTEAPSGTIVSRTTWNVTASDVNVPENKAENMLDEDLATIWHGLKSTPSSITLDLGSEKSIKAFKISALSGSLFSHNPKFISVEGSNNTTSWELFGTSPQLARPASATTPMLENYITIIYPKVKYRYYRLNITTHWSLSLGSGIAELNALE